MELDAFHQQWTQLPRTAKRLCVAYSGGLDSHTLLFGLAKTKPAHQTLSAIHVHHGLHPAADAWVAHADRVCQDLGLALTVAYAKPAQYPKLSPEAAARMARQAAWAQHLSSEGSVLVLAHHVDDQAETILQRLCRGSGVLGLSGMRPWVLDPRGYAVWRPFLSMGVDRRAIQDYAQAQDLSWIEDDSNFDLRFDRNFLRQHILPQLKTRWPEASAAMARTADLCRKAIEPVQRQAEQDLRALAYRSEAERGIHLPERLLKEQAQLQQAIPGTPLSVQALLVLSELRRREALRLWFYRYGGYPPSHAQLQRLEIEVLRAYAGGKPRLKIDHREVRRWRDLVFLAQASLPA